jgi:hypothetical protein
MHVMHATQARHLALSPLLPASFSSVPLHAHTHACKVYVCVYIYM